MRYLTGIPGCKGGKDGVIRLVSFFFLFFFPFVFESLFHIHITTFPQTPQKNLIIQK